MDFYNTNFYDKASEDYSNKRYKGKTTSYIQYFFKKRLSLTLEIIKRNLKNRRNLSILESGCADGVVLNEVLSRFSSSFRRGVGTDISSRMIDIANQKNKNRNISYFLKNTSESGQYDFVLAIGFLTPSIFDIEFSYIEEHLRHDGIIIASLASKDSFYTKIKLQNEEYIKDYWNHRQYRDFLAKRFDVLGTYPCGLFIPKLWKVPFFARFIQPMVEYIFSRIIPGYFHEQLYVLKRKSLNNK